MARHRLLTRTSLAVVVTAVLVVHGYLLYRIASHVTFAVGAALVVIVLLKHIGLLGWLKTVVRGEFGTKPNSNYSPSVSITSLATSVPEYCC